MPTQLMYARFQGALLYEVGSDGFISAPQHGRSMIGTQVFTLDIPEPERIVHYGSDRVLGNQTFPARQAPTARIQVGVEDQELLAWIMGVNVDTVGETDILPLLTDRQGMERNICAILWQAALTLNGQAGFHTYIIPSCKPVIRSPGMGENPEPVQFDLSMSLAKRYPWGMPVSSSGAQDAMIFSLYSARPPRLLAFLGDGSEDEFIFPSGVVASSTNYSVYKRTGSTVSEVTTGITKNTTKVTFDTAPANGDVIYVWLTIA